MCLSDLEKSTTEVKDFYFKALIYFSENIPEEDLDNYVLPFFIRSMTKVLNEYLEYVEGDKVQFVLDTLKKVGEIVLNEMDLPNVK